MKLKVVFLILLTFILNINHANNSEITLGEVFDKIYIYSFDDALECLNTITEDYDIMILKGLLTYLQLRLYKREVMSTARITQLENRIIKLKEEYKRKKSDEEVSFLSLMLNDLSVLRFMNQEYYSEYLPEVVTGDLLTSYRNPQQVGLFSENFEIVSSNMIHIYSYLLHLHKYEEESLTVLTDIYNYNGFKPEEKEYLYYLQLVLHSYINQNFIKTQEYLEILISLDVNPEYYHYVKAMPYLWQSLVYFKVNNYDKSISSYKVFLELKRIIDNDNVVNEMELLSPVPGIFPPKNVYNDLENVQKLYNENILDD